MSGKYQKIIHIFCKCDNQQHNKAILEAAIFYTPSRFTENSPISPGPSMIFIKPSPRKSLCLFTEVLNVKNKTDVRQVSDAKSKYKSNRAGSILCSVIPNIRRHTKIKEQVKNIFIIGFYNILGVGRTHYK